MRRVRPAARILILDRQDRLLLFRFSYSAGPLSGVEYWGVPGGGVEKGETVAEAALRELFEETGLRIDSLGSEVAHSSYSFRLSTGEEVDARDSYFLLRLPDDLELSREGFTPEETENLVEARWWSRRELLDTEANVIPGDLADVLVRAGLDRR